MIRRALRDGWSLEDAEREAERVGLRQAPHLIEFARGYIARHRTGTAPAPPASRDLPIAIEGLDAVLLVQAKEAQGDPQFTARHQGFEYQFSSDENRQTILKEPARYAIQLGGLCARMGGTVRGNPDLYAVVDGRIYIFGSEECRTLVFAAPAKYLAPDAPPWKASAAAERKAKRLLEQAVAAHGGRQLFESLHTLREAGKRQQPFGQREPVAFAFLFRFPDQFRYEETLANGNAMAVPVSGDAGLSVVTRNGRTSQQALLPGVRDAYLRRFRLNPLAVLRASLAPGFKAAAQGAGKAGGQAVEQVLVEHSGLRLTLGLDKKTRHIASIALRDRGPDGQLGDLLFVFSDYRAISGRSVPFRVTATWNGQPFPELSFALEEAEVNPVLPASLFEIPRHAAGIH
jgi:YHS domain-containing protein